MVKDCRLLKFFWRTPGTNYKPYSPWDHLRKEWSGLAMSLNWRHCVMFLNKTINCRVRDPFLESPSRKLFGLVKPFLVHMYLKTEKCMCLKLIV